MIEFERFRVIEGHTSLSQDHGKLQNVGVNEEFELSLGQVIEAELYLGFQIMQSLFSKDMNLRRKYKNKAVHLGQEHLISVPEISASFCSRE